MNQARHLRIHKYKYLWLPYRLDQLWVVEVQGLGDGLMVQSRILPMLPEVQVHLVVLKSSLNESYFDARNVKYISVLDIPARHMSRYVNRLLSKTD